MLLVELLRRIQNKKIHFASDKVISGSFFINKVINMKITKRRVFALVLSSLIPLAVFILGMIFAFANAIVNFSFSISFFILPVIALAILATLIFLNIKALPKTILVILLLIIFIFVHLFSFFLCKFETIKHYTNDSVQTHYQEDTTKSDLMPTLEEIGTSEEIEYYDYLSMFAVYFTCDSDVLICRYSKEDYLSQKSYITESFSFQKEPFSADGYICEPSVQIDDYNFNFLSVNDYSDELIYPKRLVAIAYNDTTQEIVYLSFCDDDLDYTRDLKDFLLTDCGLKHIL